MRPTMMRRCLGAVALSGALAFVAACSGPSGPGSLAPTAPSDTSGSSGGGATFSPNLVPTDPPPPPVSGRFTGGGFQFNSGVRVTRGFTIHCDNVLANNFEVNWAGGNNFHMDKNSLYSVVCDSIGLPNPPVAPVNRITASATGTLNGVAATIDFILEDHGEPGAGVDRAFISINVVGGNALTVDLAVIDGGNIQAHYDQPHK